jgi:hypothetical protein
LTPRNSMRSQGKTTSRAGTGDGNGSPDETGQQRRGRPDGHGYLPTYGTLDSDHEATMKGKRRPDLPAEAGGTGLHAPLHSRASRSCRWEVADTTTTAAGDRERDVTLTKRAGPRGGPTRDGDGLPIPRPEATPRAAGSDSGRFCARRPCTFAGEDPIGRISRVPSPPARSRSRVGHIAR